MTDRPILFSAPMVRALRDGRKTHAIYDQTRPRALNPATPIYFTADDRLLPVARYRAGMHMPRWASRLTLTVTDVRVERLQDCSRDDAIAEGVAEYPCEGPHRGPNATYWTADRGHPEHGARTTPVAAYRALWETINGEGSWEANPWVIAISFTVEQRNIDHG